MACLVGDWGVVLFCVVACLLCLGFCCFVILLVLWFLICLRGVGGVVGFGCFGVLLWFGELGLFICLRVANVAS